MWPFVNVLPYIHFFNAHERVLLTSVVFTFAILVARIALPNDRWELVRELTLRDWKDKFGVLGGVLLAIYSTATLSANGLGVFVILMPGKASVKHMQVLSSSHSGSRYQSLELELIGIKNQKRYFLTLSQKVFGQLPELERGETLRLTGKENSFGFYVESYSVIKER